MLTEINSMLKELDWRYRPLESKNIFYTSQWIPEYVYMKH